MVTYNVVVTDHNGETVKFTPMLQNYDAAVAIFRGDVYGFTPSASVELYAYVPGKGIVTLIRTAGREVR